jgi:hypothetical protein
MNYVLVQIGSYELAGTSWKGGWSVDGFIGAAHSGSPFYTFLKVTSGKIALTDTVTPPGALSGRAIDFSPNGGYVALGNQTSTIGTRVRVALVKREGESFSVVDTSTEIPGICRDIRWCPNSTYFAVGSSVTPYFTLMKRTGDTIAKVADYSVGVYQMLLT